RTAPHPAPRGIPADRTRIGRRDSLGKPPPARNPCSTSPTPPASRSSGGTRNPIPTLTSSPLKRLAEHPEHFLATARYGGLPDGPGRVMAEVETAILGELTYTILRDAILAHPPMAEGFDAVFAAIPTASR